VQRDARAYQADRGEGAAQAEGSEQEPEAAELPGKLIQTGHPSKSKRRARTRRFFVWIRPYPRHCERSEAIHRAAREGMDCFVAIAPRNDAERAEFNGYFFFAPTRLMLLISSGVRPDFSAISRSCSMMYPRAGSCPSTPPGSSESTAP